MIPKNGLHSQCPGMIDYCGYGADRLHSDCPSKGEITVDAQFTRPYGLSHFFTVHRFSGVNLETVGLFASGVCEFLLAGGVCGSC